MIDILYKPFRHWSEKGSVYLISDLHFNDEDCRLMDPHWITPEAQLEILNKTVHKDDYLICLGDMGDRTYIEKIKCKNRVLLLGNHDRIIDYEELFEDIYTGPLFIADKILLSHEPVDGLPWCLNIHGHDHSNVEKRSGDCRRINLAANVCDYTPVSLGKLIKEGALSDIKDIHRQTINRAIVKKAEREKNKFIIRSYHEA